MDTAAPPAQEGCSDETNVVTAAAFGFFCLLLLLATASGGAVAVPPAMQICSTETDVVGEVAEAGDSSVLTAPDAAAFGFFCLLLLLVPSSGGEADARPSLASCLAEADAATAVALAADDASGADHDAAAFSFFCLPLFLTAASALNANSAAFTT